MQERIFTLKKGVEVAPRFDGVTIPFQVPQTLAEQLEVAGASPEAVAAIRKAEDAFSDADKKARDNGVNVFNQAHALNIQKDVKSDALDDDATVETLRAIPKGTDGKGYRYGQVRVRSGTGGGASRVKPATIATAVGDDFISSLSPEQKALWDSKMAALNVKKETTTPENGTPTPTTAPATPAAGPKPGRESSRK